MRIRLFLSLCTIILHTTAEEYSLDTQVVTAPSDASSLSVTVFNHDEFAGKFQSVSDFLQQQGGVQVRSSGIGTPPVISIRGSTHQQVKLIVDGHEVNDSQYGGFDLNKLPVQQIEQIKITQGGLAVGGTVHIQTLSTERVSNSRAFASVGSFNTKNLGLTHYFNGYGVGLISFDKLMSEANYKFPVPSPFSQPNATDRIEALENNQFEKASTLIKWQSPQNSKHTIGLKGLYLTSKKNQPNFHNNNSNNRANVSSDDWDFQGYVENIIDDQTTLKSEVLSTKKNELYDDKFNQIGVGHDLTASTTNIKRFKQSISHNSNPFKIEGAFQHKEETFSDDHMLVSDTVKCIAPLSTCDLEAFQTTQTLTGSLNWFSKKATNQVSINMEEINLDRKQQKSFSTQEITRTNNHYNNWNIAFVNSSMDNTLIRLSLGHSVRIPSLYEVFGDRGLLKSNIALKPERSDNLSIDISYDYQPLLISSSLFYRDLNDAIVSQVSALTSTFKNMSAAQILGFQINMETTYEKLNLKLFGQVQDSYTQSEVKASNHKKLPGIFHQSFGLSIDYDFNRPIRLHYQYQNDQDLFTDAANTESLNHNGRVTHNIRIDYKVMRFQTALSIDNIFDRQFKDQANRPAPGRTLLLNFNYEI